MRLFSPVAGIYGIYSQRDRDRENVLSQGIPKGVAIIEQYHYAFCGITGDLRIPEGVIKIKVSAFSNNAITSLYLPNSLLCIEYGAFSGNPLRKIVIGKDVKIKKDHRGIGIGSNMRERLLENQAKKEKVDSGISYAEDDSGISGNFDRLYRSKGAGVYEWKNQEWVCTGGNAAADDILSQGIPEGVAIIERCQYASCGITGDLRIPEGVIKIKVSAFSNNAITSLYLPNSLLCIEKGAFSNNPLRKIVIGKDVKIEEGDSGISGNFDWLYQSKGAGVYEWKNQVWVYTGGTAWAGETKTANKGESAWAGETKTANKGESAWAGEAKTANKDESAPEVCPACKTRVSIGTKYCPECGAKINAIKIQDKRPDTIIPENIKDAFTELGLKFDASLDKCKAARDALLSQYHPDHNPVAGEHIKTMLQEKTRKINEAYNRIKDWYQRK